MRAGATAGANRPSLACGRCAQKALHDAKKYSSKAESAVNQVEDPSAPAALRPCPRSRRPEGAAEDLEAGQGDERPAESAVNGPGAGPVASGPSGGITEAPDDEGDGEGDADGAGEG